VKIAYVITAHKNAKQLRRLLKAIDYPGNTYVLHVDVKAPADVHQTAREFVSGHPSAATIPSDNIIWGSWRLARVQILAIAQALKLSKDWGYCLNISGQDYPLKTQAELGEIFDRGPTGANYLEVLKFADASSNTRKRLEYYWAPWRGKMHKLFRRRAPKFEVFWGSNQWAFTREACEFVADSPVSRKMQRAFRLSLCADELIFQNIIMHSPVRENIINNTMRKVVWNGGSHPKIFTIADRDELLNSQEWFARKFDHAVDEGIMDALDAALQQRAAGYAQQQRLTA